MKLHAIEYRDFGGYGSTDFGILLTTLDWACSRANWYPLECQRSGIARRGKAQVRIE